MSKKRILLNIVLLAALMLNLVPARVLADTPPVPVVAIHVSELTQALWSNTSWHYFVMPESLKEALNSDGTPWVEVSDAGIATGALLHPDGSPRYPILISLASEVIGDDESDPLRDYVAAGGFLFVGSSTFTRNPDGTSRTDFALADEMGLHSLGDWYQNSTFTKVIDHRLVSHIPSGTLTWGMPLHSEQTPWGISPGHSLHRNHYVWHVAASGAEVIANGNSGPLLATKGYGEGHFIYHGALNPLIGHGGPDPGMYAYLIYRNAIEWAFEAADVPIVKRSPWRYEYDAAFVVRHDFENTPSRIQSIKSSSQAEHSLGAKGDYYFCTGTLRVGSEDTQMSDELKLATIADLQDAVQDYGATIGSHNGGLPNPNYSWSTSSYQYWHWGTDEALDANPPGYTDGYEYAYTSVLTSFLDIEGWLAGLDNGRPGCGAAGNCPRTWVSPYFNSTREGSYNIMEQLGSVIMGEQKIGPFPHWTLSYETTGKRYSHVTLPVSDWYIGTTIAQSMESGHNAATIHALVDFYYDLGALINLYCHQSSAGGNAHEYAAYGTSKPRVWSTNAVGIRDWWTLRSNVVVTPTYSKAGSTAIAGATVTGATDPETAIEVVIPHWDSGAVGDLQVLLDGAPADPANYRTTNYGVKVKVGTTVSGVEVRYTPLAGWVQTDWAGGAGQAVWADETRYDSATGVDDSADGQVRLSIASGGDVLFSDDFTRPPDPDPVPFTWIIPETNPTWPNRGTFNTDGGALNSGTSEPDYYGFAYTNTLTIDNHSVEADIRFPQVVSTLGGGIFGRLNPDPDNGERYAVWIYPETSPGGTARIRAIKFYDDWGLWNGLGAMVNIPGGVGSDWHHLKIAFSGNQIQVFYDGSLIITATDDDYTSGYVGVGFWTSNRPGNIYGPSYNNFVVRDSSGDVVFSDDFGPDPVDPLLPWIEQLGTWTVTDEMLQGSSPPSEYVYVYTDTMWTNYTVEGRIQFPTGAYGGGLSGRVNPATGDHYAAWVYPEGASNSPNVLKLIKFHDWTTWNGQSMNGQPISLSSVGTGWHTLKMAFDGNRIRVYYDGDLKIDVTDDGYDGRPAYLSGGVGVNAWTPSGYSGPYAMAADDIVVRSPAEYGSSGTLLSSAFDGGFGVQWQTIAWNAAAGGSTGVRVRTRTADRADHLASATWSDWYTTSGSPVTSENKRWIQYELELTSSDPSATPVFYENGITYVPGILLPGSNLTYTGPIGGDSEAQVTLSATLLDDNDDPIVGRTVDFTLSGVNGLLTTSGTTNGNGEGSVPLDLLTAPGQYSLTVAFAGDAEFAPAVPIDLPFEVTSPWSEWVQDTQGDFQSDTLTDTNATAQPGSVLLEETLIGEGEESGEFSVDGTPGWGYRRRLFIDNNVADELPAGYSVNLILDTATLFTDGKLQADGDDLRVVWEDGLTSVELDRVAETSFNSPSTEIWFETQAPIPGNERDRSYYIYYGNPSAGAPPADRANVYALWDDFDGDTLDPRWNSLGTVTVSGGQAHLSSGADIIADTTPFTYAVLEMRLKLVNDNNYAWWGWEDGLTGAPNIIVFEETSSSFDGWIRKDNGTIRQLPISDPPDDLTVWHTYVTDWWLDNARWLIDGTEVTNASTDVPDDPMYANFYARSVPMDIDWVKARLRAAQEPSVTLATSWLEYASPGQVLSIPYDTNQFSAWKYLTWDETIPPDTSISLRVRTAAVQDDLGTAPWVDYLQSGLLISNDAGRWVQYEATLATTDPFTTPALHKVIVYYTSQPATLTVAPDPETIVAGEAAAYTASVDDGSNTWDATGETGFSIAESGHGGSWAGNVYTSQVAGDWTVTGEYADLSYTATLHVQSAADLSVIKTSSADPVRVGTTLFYTVTITNDGPEMATGVTVTDTLPTGVALVSATSSQGAGCSGMGTVTCNLGALDDAATVTIVVTPTITGRIGNMAEAAGTDPLGNPVSDSDTITVTVIDPAIDIVKTADPMVVNVGDTAAYTITVENTGDSDLRNVSVDDHLAGCTLTGPDGDDGNRILELDETWAYTCSVTAGSQDIVNTATVTATDEAGSTVSDSDTITVTVIHPAISITKTADPTVVNVGDTVTYTITVENTSDSNLTNVTVEDHLAGCTLTGPGGDDGNRILELDETWAYTCSVTAGSQDIVNTATVTATDEAGSTVSNSAQAAVDVIHPNIEIAKTPDTQTVYSGSTVTFTIAVINTGDATLTNVTVTDGLVPACNASLGSLAAGASTSYNCTVENVAADFTNSATVTGTLPVGDDVTDTDTAMVHVEPAPAPPGSQIYLPIILNNSVPPAPDLVVENIVATRNSVQVVIKNQGDAAVLPADVFWVDLYVNPNPVPTGVNQTWDDGRCVEGVVWGVAAPALPLEPGGVITLTIGDVYYWPDYSRFSGSFPEGMPIYVQVDSANTNTTYGAVLENHEITGGPYNNISGPVHPTNAIGEVPAEAGLPVTGDHPPASSRNLPPRP